MTIVRLPSEHRQLVHLAVVGAALGSREQAIPKKGKTILNQFSHHTITTVLAPAPPASASSTTDGDGEEDSQQDGNDDDDDDDVDADAVLVLLLVTVLLRLS